MRRSRYLYQLADFLRSVGAHDQGQGVAVLHDPHIASLELACRAITSRAADTADTDTTTDADDGAAAAQEGEGELVVAVGSKNPVKVEAARQAFTRVYPGRSIVVRRPPVSQQGRGAGSLEVTAPRARVPRLTVRMALPPPSAGR